jgi:type IV pilus assembly protein PilC
MAQYKYRAIDENGKMRKGRMHAANLLEIEHRLSNLHYDLISCSEINASNFRFGRKNLSRRELINLTFQMEQLTKAGVALLDGLKDLRDSTDPSYFRDVLASLVEGIEGGKSFSEALKDFPNDFDTVFVSLIEVGEETGELPRVLKDMAETLRWADELVASAVKIMMYPAIVTVVIFGVTSFLMIYLVPQIIPFIREMGGTIPTHTLALIATSDFFGKYWWAIFMTPFVLNFTIKWLAKTRPKFRYQLDKLKLKLPLVGEIAFKIKLARFANYMALLYSSGITVLRSLEISKALMDNMVMSEALENVRIQIAEGGNISDCFARTNLFPPLVVRMLRVGENTGNLDEALINVSYFYNREVKESIDKLEPAMNPIMTVIMGCLMGWIMISVLGPIWDTMSKVGT